MVLCSVKKSILQVKKSCQWMHKEKQLNTSSSFSSPQKKKRALPLEIRNLEFFLPTPIIKLLPYTSPLKKVADPVSGLHKHSLCCGASTGLPMKAMSKQ